MRIDLVAVDLVRIDLVTPSQLTPLLTHAGITVENVTTDLPPVVNRTGSDCFYSCPFNDRSSSEYIEWIGSFQPCVYTLEVTRVFKGNYKVCLSSSSLTHSSLHAGMPLPARANKVLSNTT